MDPTLFTPTAAVALVTLTILEIVLGIDNVIFIAILAGKLPESQQRRARTIGLLLAMVQRILLLLVITWLLRLERIVLFHVPWGESHGPAHEIEQAATNGTPVSIKDLIIALGGLFLIFKATREIHDKLEGPEPAQTTARRAAATFGAVLVQIMLLDIVFSIDSVLTAVGLTKHIEIMIAAVVISVIIMIAFSGAVARFVEKHPTMKMLALAILLTIGVLLLAEGFGIEVPRGYLYFAMAFAFGVEMLNIKVRGHHRKGAKNIEME
ncbi:MAG: TerC family protein [Phycisphaerales bacterium]|nr:TerC family protein [Phycisphaerales bacterium]